ncbi:hypothetical protein DVU_2008 [Nitratidesulfovibrio vulgaris str. Hildenborough]|uniref:Uncharacterized protein n=1 Tax=Nitratidesulfovibrio vulgaris (strain ATCC 29579 / DSM 644 / CCUG 34227 / NCIMB 8303 / VKM B-1760 / Hildenborough) TaxID=882 RepID=Q72AI5_NITV2|nr:hypothetical protein DVU_2008 [Nitratidesulfovibrio vulgaris str. Hildenborough]
MLSLFIKLKCRVAVYIKTDFLEDISLVCSCVKLVLHVVLYCILY